MNTTTEAEREGAAGQVGSVWLGLLAWPSRGGFSLLLLHCLGGGTVAGGDIHLDGLMLAW